jgi:UDP-N-acetyl-D-galactosamine dehydrogenase
MPLYVSSQIIKLMIAKAIQPRDSKILMLGVAFKENCPDIRNSKVVDIVIELGGYGAKVDVYDPWVNASEIGDEYDINLVTEPAKGAYDVVVIAVAHECFRELGEDGIKSYGKDNSVLYDIKYVLPADAVDDRL